MKALPEFIKNGAYVSWRAWGGDVTVRVSYVERFRIGYDSADGVLGFVEENIGGTLVDAVKNWRPATDEAIAGFNDKAVAWYPIQ